MLGRGASHGDLCTPKCGEVKGDWEPWPASKHQIMWTIPYCSRSGGIVGLPYFSQVSWPVGLFVFTQLPSHSYYGLMWSLHEPISLQLVWHSLQFLHVEECTQFINNAAHKVSTPVAQEPGQGTEEWDVTLIQELGSCFSCLIGVTYAITYFVKWSWNTRTLATLDGWFSSMVISMLVKSTCRRSNGAVATIGCRGTAGSAWSSWWISASDNHSWPPEVFS